MGFGCQQKLLDKGVLCGVAPLYQAVSMATHCGLGEAVAAASKNCALHRKAYDQCFIHWYRSSFLSGDLSIDSDPCREKLETYRNCVLKELREQGFEKVANFEFAGHNNDFDA